MRRNIIFISIFFLTILFYVGCDVTVKKTYTDENGKEYVEEHHGMDALKSMQK